MKELVVVAKDRVGLLADISEALGNAHVNIESVSADVAGKNAVVRLIVKKEKEGKEALRRGGFKTVESDTLVLKLEDRPGELAKVARTLGDAGVNMMNVYIIGKESGVTFVAVKVDEMTAAKKLLREYL